MERFVVVVTGPWLERAKGLVVEHEDIEAAKREAVLRVLGPEGEAEERMRIMLERYVVAAVFVP